MRVLLVEDHQRLASFVHKGLAVAGFEIDSVARGDFALEAAQTSHYDAIILDLGLPDVDGLQVLRHLRAADNMTPVLILTSRIKVGDRVAGLNAGADDYLTKPFAMEELIARVHALLRRPSATLGTLLTAGNLSFDPAARETRVGDTAIVLSGREAGVLERLLRRSGKVVPKSLLEEGLYGWGSELSSNSVEVFIHRLRKKLTSAGAAVTIHTVRGVGYMLVDSNGNSERDLA